MVYLVGAGPGDPGLITVKALDLLRRADVVLFDRLIDSLLLFQVRPDCVMVDVGKSAGRHSKTQEEITDLLVEYGRRGLEVVRLKGGDPFLFGRGGEEAERLAKEGIPFVIVPGVSALTAVTAYAGIPLTHRDFGSTFGVATGHAADSKDRDPVRWSKMAEGVDTIVVFMGVGNLETIISGILKGGKSPSTPAALLERGATASQRIVTGTLEDIVEKARVEKVVPPALFVVGETVKLAGKLSWYHPGPLAGIHVGVTRPLAQSRSFSEKLAALGAEPVLMPAIETKETIDTPEVRKALEDLHRFDYVVFSSANGVDAFFSALRSTDRDSRSLAGKITAVIGPATGEALARYGVRADMIAETFVAEGFLETLLKKSIISGKRFLLVRSDIGRTVLAQGLKDAGAFVDDVAIYSTRSAKLSPYILERLAVDGVDIITFTSSSTVHGLFSQIPANALDRKTKLASIGPQTTRALLEYGATPDIEASEYTTDGLVNAIVAWKENHKSGKIL